MPNQIILRLLVFKEYFRKIAMTNLDYENDTELYVLYFSKHLSIDRLLGSYGIVNKDPP